MHSIFKKIGLENFVAIDVETTGLDYKEDKIIEISACRFVNGKQKDTFSQLINPNKKIPYFIENLTGITNDKIKEQPLFKDVSTKFIEFIQSDPLVGHNINFDLNFIKNELSDWSFKVENNFICDTYYLSRMFLYHLNAFSLSSLCNHFNIDVNSSHRALPDAINSGLLFNKLIPEIYDVSEEAIDLIVEICKVYSGVNSRLFYEIYNSKKSYKDEKLIHRNKFIFEHKLKCEGEIDSLEKVFLDDGILSKEMKNYEFRESQFYFSKDCKKAIDNNSILLSEAGTGLGKSLGYLCASMITNKNSNIIISTSTHSLQGQLLDKDIPLITKLLNKNFKAMVVKGKSNYLCLKRLCNTVENLNSCLKHEEITELLCIIVWACNTNSGDVSECNSFNSKTKFRIWDLLKYKNEFCGSHNHSECFYNNILKESINTDIFIVNHALLVSNIDKTDSILKEDSICIIDEAHKVIENCRDYLTESLSYRTFQIEYENFLVLLDDLKNITADSNVFNIEISDLKAKFIEFVDMFYDYSKEFSLINIRENNKNDILDIRYDNSAKENHILAGQFNFLDENIIQIVNLFSLLKDKIFQTYKSKISHKYKSKFNMFLQRLNHYQNFIHCKIFSNSSLSINWIKVYMKNNQFSLCVFKYAPINVYDMMNKIIHKNKSTILCSATIAIDDDFSFFIDESGLGSFNVSTKTYPSPYYFNDQIKTFIYNVNEDVNSFIFIEKVSKMIFDLKDRINKRMLVLCTSFRQIKQFKELFKNKFNDQYENIYFQENNSSKQNLLNQYIKNNGSILFGTNTFWEGVDLPNDLLEVLIILKLPFSNPSNPIVEAKINEYMSKNMDGFYNYQIPTTILKLKQGFGRLIRNHEDSGVCIITDPRLINKRYGSIIIDSLPVIPIIRDNHMNIVSESERFLNVQ